MTLLENIHETNNNEDETIQVKEILRRQLEEQTKTNNTIIIDIKASYELENSHQYMLINKVNREKANFRKSTTIVLKSFLTSSNNKSLYCKVNLLQLLLFNLLMTIQK